MEKIKCPYCNKIYSIKGIGTHIWRVHGSGSDFDPNRGYKEGDRIVWNKGLTKKDDIRVRKYGENLKGKKSHFKGKSHTEEARHKMSISAKKAFDMGIHANWKSRKDRSYPERYFEKILEVIGILDECEIEYPIKNGIYQYFLDFYFPLKKINLEIDGEQHRLKDRIESDFKRDSFLNSVGIKVFRIKWVNLRNKDAKKYLQNRIEDFIDFYDNAEVV